MRNASVYEIQCTCGQTIQTHSRAGVCKCGRIINVGWGDADTMACALCECKLRLLDTSTVCCNHTSLTLGIDLLQDHVYDHWMVVQAELERMIEI